VIKLPKKKYTPKQDVQLGKEAASEVRKQYPIIEDQHIAKSSRRLATASSPRRRRN
jgi:predicted Zn-dependent protease